MAKVPGVLIVDQDVDRRFNVKQLVARAQLEVRGESGYGAAAVTLALELKPDVILCAMEESLNRSRQTVESLVESLPETPVIAYSPDTKLEVARQAMQSGARDFLTVPMTEDQLRQAILASLDSEGRRRMRLAGAAVPAPQGAVVTVFGPKGGIGKTTVVTNLGVALARLGQSVVTIDADAGFGDVTGMLNIQPVRTILDLNDKLGDVTRESLPRFLLSHESGMSVLASPARGLDWQKVPLKNFKEIVDKMARSFDIVVIDTSGILDELTLVALKASTFVLWMTTTEFSSVKDSQSALRILREMGLPLDRIRLLINQTSPVNDVRLETVSETLELPIFWSIPYDKGIRRSAQLGQPVLEAEPKSKIARSFVELAEKVSGVRPAAPPVPLGRFRQRKEKVEETVVAASFEGENP